ncbi:PilT/PilU family type 4a pilus ATPase [Verrucomicrobia bacterium]|nr:PilT/PilU family type 4a pilus ATPase [Verrucomicrobiota bacterium]MDB4798622.1 PilT/PilU family type 4a pilus ATPase [Verrucomicrobiota bacterium]
METVETESKLSQILCWCETQSVSDLHLQSDATPRIRQQGRLCKVPNTICSDLNENQLHQLLEEGFSSSLFERIIDQREVDLSFLHSKTRYRANFNKQQGNPSCSFRRVPAQEFNLADLRLPASLADFVKEPRGLILAAGPTGQGKSTTMRALIQTINETKPLRIISIEDPIEYVFTAQESQIEQREVGIDTENFETGIRNAMRQDPDVIFVGEIRDRESIHAAMQASETGHLVLTTLHADSTAQAIARICELYPSDEQSNISGLLARNLKSVICQRLIPDTENRLVPCIELMRHDHGIETAIRSKNLTLLTGIIEAAIEQGMHSFDQYLQELLIADVITEETARDYAVNRHRLDLNLRGIKTNTPILVTGDRPASL